MESRRKGISYLQLYEGRLTELVIFCLGTAFEDRLFQEIWKGWEDQEEDVSSYWVTLRKTEDTGVTKREAQDRFHNEHINKSLSGCS
jgi:hypothetical protein